MTIKIDGCFNGTDSDCGNGDGYGDGDNYFEGYFNGDRITSENYYKRPIYNPSDA